MTDRLAVTIGAIQPLDQTAMNAAADRQRRLTKPTGALGRLEPLSVQLAGITAQTRPRLGQPAIVVAAASHGVAAEGVSAYPGSVTAQMVQNFLAGGAAINTLASIADARLIVVDAGVDGTLPDDPRLVRRALARGTRNFRNDAAMPRDHAVTMLLAGIALVDDLVADGVDVVALGEMGIGNTTAAAAIVAAVTVSDPARVTGRGTAIDDRQLAHKITVITDALHRHQPGSDDPIGVLSAVGGYEIGLLAGCCLGAAAQRLPIVLDGYITAAAALIAAGCCPAVRSYLIAGHRSTEPGHRIALDALGIMPLLDLDLRLGEASGAALALPIVLAAARLLDEMATFEDASVDNRTTDELPGGADG